MSGRGGRGGHYGWSMQTQQGWGKQKANLQNPHGSDINKYLKPGAPKPEFRKSRATEPTVDQIQGDNLTSIAKTYWAPGSKTPHQPFSSELVDQIYNNDIKGSNFSVKRIMMLEFSQFLENFLWPNYSSETTSLAHLMAIVVIVNEKFRERVPAWTPFQLRPEHFHQFFHQVLKWAVAEAGEITVAEQTKLIIFLDHCFCSMEVDLVRTEVQRLVSLPMWGSLLPNRRESELNKIPKWKKYWKLLQKKDTKETPEMLEQLQFERTFLSAMIQKFLSILYTVQEKDAPTDVVDFCERFLLLIIDLEALLPTRRFFNTVLDDSHLVVRASLSPLYQRPEGHLFSQLVDQVRFYTRFEINDQTGEPLTDKEMTSIHYSRMSSLQRAVFVKYPQLRSLALATIASIEERDQLEKHFLSLDRETLYNICEYLHLVPAREGEAGQLEDKFSQEFLSELIVSRHEKRDSQLAELNAMPLYPTEEFIWDEGLVPGEYYQGETPLALPKLNLQFLTLHDYLLRNFKLFQLESTYEIRQDVEDIVARMQPWTAEDGKTIFNGWARMALPVQTFTIVEVAKPNIGEKQPSRVRADVSVHLGVKDAIKHEWENLKRHDVCFLLTVRPPTRGVDQGLTDLPAQEYCRTTGLMYVRGCEVEGMLDENGRVIEEYAVEKPRYSSGNRTFRVLLDCNQYYADMDTTSKGAEDVYSSFNVLMRRKPKENNFKAVLETIRDLMNTSCVVPEWLHDIVLGYGDPASAHYTNMENNVPELNFNDTFLNFDHLRASFPSYEVKVEGDFAKLPSAELVPPYKITFEDIKTLNKKRQVAGDDEEKVAKVLTVEPLKVKARGPYPRNIPKKNTVRFTPTQVEAIRSGINPGLTMVVGPPGTGKTDVAVQIISNLYHNFPDQRTLIVTHSNQALNQLFEKIMALDVDERHLLRLGHGEEALETEKDFSRYGRVNYVLAKRMELLEEVSRLQKSLGVPGDVTYTCETAKYFYLYQISSRWEEYMYKLNEDQHKTSSLVSDLFPFHVFFSNAAQPLIHGRSYEEHYECAMSCWRYIQDVFTQLDEFWAFELLRSGLDRTRYLCVKEAKIIAMTCTHAALKRQELVQLGFKYDNILMEESAQILEIETFIPLLLQTPQGGTNRLKRWIMIGDHHQLPPVVKNMAFEKFSNMEQSLFTRFVRLGVPTIDLDAQGRSRPSICSLYNWRYKSLGNLPHVLNHSDYQVANAGFSYDYQLINVPDFNGIGESQPSPFFYQNLAEAEYVVAVYMFMRLTGYPAHKISILTTYNGQKSLLKDVCIARCAGNPLIGMPHKIATVDKYQGQQNDYILLSLVRTYNVGHLRDVRRLVVAMSRARLGLYVFARVSLFKNCFELQPAFNILMKRPLQLHICPSEMYPGSRQASVTAPNPTIVYDMPMMSKFVADFYQQRVKQLKIAAAKTLMTKPGEVKSSEGKGAPVHPATDRYLLSHRNLII